jgi:hypothetical protein
LLLFTGEFIEQPVRVFFGFPIGNIISWLGLMALALLTKATPLSGISRSLSDILLTAALSWLPLGYYFSGNVTFSFSNSYMGWELWLAYSLIIAACSLGLALRSLYLRTRQES